MSAISITSLSSDFPDDDRHFPEAYLHRRLVAPLAGDDLEARSALSDDERLDDPLLGDRGHQLGEVAHDLAGLIRVGRRSAR